MLTVGFADGYREFFSQMGGKLYFAATAVGSGTEIWVTDGTEANTQLLKDI
jgi:hypothetical protein